MLMEGVGEQLMIFLRALLFGAVLGMLYDVVRITRTFAGVNYRSVDTAPEPLWRRVFVFIGDLIFSIVSAVLVSIFIYRYNYGMIRFYSFFGFAVGFFAYRSTAGRIVILVADVVAGGFRRFRRLLSAAMHKRFDRYITGDREKEKGDRQKNNVR